MSGRVMRCCVVLFFALTSVSAVQKKLDSINDLKKIKFGQSVPKHSLLLLYWFANEVDINDNNVITLTFDADGGDYGSHHYGNSEGLLEPLPRENEYTYFTIGNLHQQTSMPLPPYVGHPRAEYEEGNRDRIIFRVREQNRGRRSWQRIDQVYITQHYATYEHRGTGYDPARTYRITTNLLRQIREFSLGENQQQLLYLRNYYRSNADVSQIRNTWVNLAGLGLLLSIVIHSSNQNNKQSDFVVNFNDDEDKKAPTGNRNSGSYNTSEPVNNDWGCMSICAFILFIVLFICVLCFFYL
ncbi:uncharacterized protein LOC131982928 [Centropristis striata]|uniref:uncharacterized protein LOC131982928 n=1 Tax=Centropristis striata TaxID=184440 RepID=UPI0027DEFCEB|nr:uncharacterized protein LOC131982928 [Centropristis striata]XP_059203510.1 uncharacterized protein LOC131982928 [Centropristis striata]